jgi:hypothetical protein
MSNSAAPTLTANPSIDTTNTTTPISMDSNGIMYPPTPPVTPGNYRKRSIDHLLPEVDTNQPNHTPTTVGKYLSNKATLDPTSSTSAIATLANCESMQKDVISDEYAKYLTGKGITKHQLKDQLDHVQRIIKVSKLITFKYPDDMEAYKKSHDEMFKIMFAYKPR